MKKIFLIFFFFLLIWKCSLAQDSLRVILCTTSGTECYLGPFTLDKTIQRIDSLGDIREINSFHWERCDVQNADSAYVHMSNEFFDYDSLHQLVFHQYNYYNGDTAIQQQHEHYYIYDSLGNEVSYRFYLLNSPNNDKFDSTIYSSNNLKIYKLSERWSFALLALDTYKVEAWDYDTLDRLIFYGQNFYPNFQFSETENTYYLYDSLGNNIITAYNFTLESIYEYDSTRYLNVFDTLLRKTESWYQGWDSLNAVWDNLERSTFFYDSLSRILTAYYFKCPDSLCTDSTEKTEYTYDAPYDVEFSFYDYNGWWEFSGNDYVDYDSFDSLIADGNWFVDPEGCDDFERHSYDYNVDHDLIHTHYFLAHCNSTEINCDLYSLNSDSMLVAILSHQVFCPYDTVQLPIIVEGGTPPYTLQWTPAVNILDPDSLSPHFITDTTIIYTLTVTDSMGLTTNVSDTLFVHPKHIYPVTISSAGVPCQGSPVQLFFNEDSLIVPWSFQWTRNGNNYPSVNDTLSATTNGVYAVIMIDNLNNCSVLSSNSITLNFLAAPQAEIVALGDTSFCEGLNVELLADTFLQVIWNTGDTTLSIYADITGTYFTVVTDSNGCSDTSNVIQVNVFTDPIVELGSDSMICITQNIVLDAGSGFQNYLWQDGSTTQTYNASSGIADTISYHVQVIDSNGCTNADSIHVIFDLCSAIIHHSNNNDYIIYPNPAASLVVIRAESQLKPNTYFKIFDLFGREVLSVLVVSSLQQVELNLLAKGVYQFRFIASGEELKSGKFIIE